MKAGMDYAPEIIGTITTTAKALYNLEAGVLAGQVGVGTAAGSTAAVGTTATAATAGGSTAVGGTLSSSLAGLQSIEAGIATESTKASLAALKTEVVSSSAGVNGFATIEVAADLLGSAAIVAFVAYDVNKGIKCMDKNSDTLTKYKQAADGGSLIFKAIDKVGDFYDQSGITSAIEKGYTWWYTR